MSAEELVRPRFSDYRYQAINDGSLRDSLKHFTSRGHVGPVQCVAATEDFYYIASGGVDYTMRIWSYSPSYESYFLWGLVGTKKPKDAAVLERSFCQELCSKPIDWTKEARRGVTAVAVMDSQSVAFRVGEKVTVEPDTDYVQQEFDYLNFEWEDCIDEMLGKDFEVEQVEEDSKAVWLPNYRNDKGNTRFPTSCLKRQEEPPKRNGPFICGTAQGDVHILCAFSHGPVDCNPEIPSRDDSGCSSRQFATEDGNMVSFEGLHVGAVNAIAVLALGQDRSNFLVVTAGDDGDAALLKVSTKEVLFEDRGRPFVEGNEVTTQRVLVLDKAGFCSVDGAPIRLSHKIDEKPTPVLQVKHVGEHNDPSAVSLVTLAQDGAYLWNLEGKFLMKLTVQKPTLVWDIERREDRLEERDIEKYLHLTVANKTNGSLILMSGCGPRERGHNRGYTAVWGIQDGLVSLPNFAFLDKAERQHAFESALRKFSSSGVCPPPTALYHKEGDHIDCDQSSEMTKFAAEIDPRLRHRVVLWNLIAVPQELLVLEPPGPAGLLIMPGREWLMMTLRHKSKVWALRAVQDPGIEGEGGAVVLTGCEDGCVYAWDVAGQDARQVVARMRSMSPQELFMPPLLLIVSSLQIMSFAFTTTVPWWKKVKEPGVVAHRYLVVDVRIERLEIPPEMVFWPQILGTLCLMLFFIVFAMTGGVFLIDQAIVRLQDTSCFLAEKGSKLGPCHVFLSCIRNFRTGVVLLMQLCSTILVLPMFQTVATAVDCYEGHLESVPHVTCYDKTHKILLVAIWILFPLYFFVLIPFAAVAGDPFYIPRSTLWDYKIWNENNMWRSASRRKATDQYVGFLHQQPLYSFTTPFLELCAKTILPFAMAEFTHKPIVQMVLVSSVGVAMYVQSVVFPQYLEKKLQIFVHDLRLMTMLSMLTALLVSVLGTMDIKEAKWPVFLLGSCNALVLCHLIYKFTTTKLTKRTVHRYECGDDMSIWNPASEGKPSDRETDPLFGRDQV